MGKLKRVSPGFSPSGAQFDRVAETIDLLSRAQRPCLRALQPIGPTAARNEVPGDRAYTRVPPGEKSWLRKIDGTGSLANITETPVNNGFSEVQDGHSSQKSPTIPRTRL